MALKVEHEAREELVIIFLSGVGYQLRSHPDLRVLGTCNQTDERLVGAARPSSASWLLYVASGGVQGPAEDLQPIELGVAHRQ